MKQSELPFRVTRGTLSSKSVALTSHGQLAGEDCYNKRSYILMLCCCWFSHRYIYTNAQHNSYMTKKDVICNDSLTDFAMYS